MSLNRSIFYCLIFALIFYGLEYHISKSLIHIATLLSIANIFILIKNKTKKELSSILQQHSTVIKMSLIMMTAALITIISTQIFNNSIAQRHEKNFAYPLIYFSIITLSLRLKDEDYRTLFYAAIMGCISMAWAGIYDYLQAGYTSYRTAGTQNMPIIYATSMALLTSYMMAEFFERLKKHQWSSMLLCLISFLAGFTAITFTASRGPILAIVIIFCILLIRYFISTQSKRKFFAIFSFIIGLTIIASAITLNTHTGKSILNRFEVGISNIGKFMDKSDTSTTSAGLRLDMWKAAIITTYENPVIGIGNGTHHDFFADLHEEGVIKSNMNAIRNLDHVHNDILQILMSLGLFFGFITLLFIAYPAMVFLLSVNKKNSAIIGLTICLSYFLCGLTDSPSIRANSLTIFLLLINLLLLAPSNKLLTKTKLLSSSVRSKYHHA